MKQELKVLFMGTPDFALPSLEMLDNKYDVIAVFCQPDKANGRGKKITFSPVKEYALKHNIDVYQPESFKNNSCAEIISSLDPGLIVVAAYGKILPEYVLNYPRYGCINVHGSLLPKYRGASPIQAAVLNGDVSTGITIMHMAKSLDSGDIILSRKTNIGEYETAGELFDRLSVMGAECLDDAVMQLISGTASRTPQVEKEASYVSMINKDMGKLDFSESSDAVKRKVYGLNPWPSAYIETEKNTYKIHRVIKGSDTTSCAGIITSISKAGIEVACGDGKTVIITEIQKQGKRKMDAYSFTLGHTITVGQNIFSI